LEQQDTFITKAWNVSIIFTKSNYVNIKKIAKTVVFMKLKRGDVKVALQKIVSCKKHKDKKIKWKLPLTLPKLRPLVMKSDKDLKEDELWQKEIPYDTRQLGLKDLIGNFKSCITNKKRGNIDKFQVGFKSKRNLNQVFFCK